MPFLHIRTNQSVSNPSSLITQASALCAKMLAKPEAYVMVELQQHCHMCFAGNDEPLAYLELKSLGLDKHQTTAYSQQLCDFIEQQLGIPSARIYIEFSSGERCMWGFNRRTFG